MKNQIRIVMFSSSNFKLKCQNSGLPISLLMPQASSIGMTLHSIWIQYIYYMVQYSNLKPKIGIASLVWKKMILMSTVGHFQRFEFPAGMRENFRISSWKMRENAEIFKIRNSVLFSIYEGKISLNDILYF